MSHGDVIPNVRREAPCCHMDDGAVLQAHASAYSDGEHVASNDSAVPNAGALTEVHVTDDAGRISDEHTRGDAGGHPFEGDESWVVRAFHAGSIR